MVSRINQKQIGQETHVDDENGRRFRKSPDDLLDSSEMTLLLNKHSIQFIMDLVVTLHRIVRDLLEAPTPFRA